MKDQIEGGKTKKRRIGFLDIVIIVIIIILLMIIALIMIPNFFFPIQFPPLKNSEAKSNLGAIYTAQTAYFGVYNTYAGNGIINGQHLNAFQLINWEPAGQNRYRYILHDGDIQSKPTLTTCNIPYALKSSRDGFTACATANIDKDEFCDVWCINDDKVLRNMTANDESFLEDGNDIENE